MWHVSGVFVNEYAGWSTGGCRIRTVDKVDCVQKRTPYPALGALGVQLSSRITLPLRRFRLRLGISPNRSIITLVACGRNLNYISPNYAGKSCTNYAYRKFPTSCGLVFRGGSINRELKRRLVWQMGHFTAKSSSWITHHNSAGGNCSSSHSLRLALRIMKMLVSLESSQTWSET